jgi:hypothetical protein
MFFWKLASWRRRAVLGKGKVIYVPTYHVNKAYGDAGKIPHILNRGIKRD